MRDSSRLDRIADAYRIHIQQVGQELRSRTFCWTSAAAAALRLVGLLDLASTATRVRAVLFGIGAALVLDEFALILNLADVYWAPQGRESIDAVVIFTRRRWSSLLSAATSGGPRGTSSSAGSGLWRGGRRSESLGSDEDLPSGLTHYSRTRTGAFCEDACDVMQ